MQVTNSFKTKYWTVYLCGEQDSVKRILYFAEEKKANDTYDLIKKAMLEGKFAVEINDLKSSQSIINLTSVLEVKKPDLI